eukprot:TRINITY_DN139_c0_g2_i4.p2 TRINITY_DN139_c0_g2~~TRINITY_DN139_c0_g2_i4.p2  ORF type:complete len:141 (+),score=12.28 TRINITY_DN139_c0_g2_i4:658-1080(+)
MAKAALERLTAAGPKIRDKGTVIDPKKTMTPNNSGCCQDGNALTNYSSFLVIYPVRVQYIFVQASLSSLQMLIALPVANDNHHVFACVFIKLLISIFALQKECQHIKEKWFAIIVEAYVCLLYTSPSPRDGLLSRMPSSA